MTTVLVPGSATGDRMPVAMLVGVGAVTIVVVGVLSLVSLRDPALWPVTLCVALACVAFLGQIALTHLGRKGTLRLRHAAPGWLARGSFPAQVLAPVTAIAIALICAATLLGQPDPHPGMWLMAVVAVLGLVDGWRRLSRPPGWQVDQHVVAATAPGRGTVALSWHEVEAVELTRRELSVLGRGQRACVKRGDIHSDPTVLARLFEFYLANEDRRAELDDDRLLTRLRAGQF